MANSYFNSMLKEATKIGSGIKNSVGGNFDGMLNSVKSSAESQLNGKAGSINDYKSQIMSKASDTVGGYVSKADNFDINGILNTYKNTVKGFNIGQIIDQHAPDINQNFDISSILNGYASQVGEIDISSMINSYKSRINGINLSSTYEAVKNKFSGFGESGGNDISKSGTSL